MTPTWSGLRWRVLGSSVTGVMHRRLGRPNQDALLLPAADAELPLLLAVADGHGNSLSFRSDRGARLAVATAQAICHWSLATADPTNLAAFQCWTVEQLPRYLVSHWRQQVEQDFATYPFSLAEQRVRANSGYDFAYPYLAYGATLLAVMVTASFILYVQLGDGDILTISDDGQVRRPLPQDVRLFDHMTTSLCTEEAWDCVRVAFQRLDEAPPALILAATDGCANSYQDDTGFLQLGSELLSIFRAEGPGRVEQQLTGWLDHTSRAGSGDDITVGLLYRVDLAIQELADVATATPAAR